MYSFRQYATLVQKIVENANKVSSEWRWSVRYIGKSSIRIAWSRLGHQLTPSTRPYFKLELMPFDDHAPDILVIDNYGDTVGIWTVAPDSELGMENAIRCAMCNLIELSGSLENCGLKQQKEEKSV